MFNKVNQNKYTVIKNTTMKVVSVLLVVASVLSFVNTASANLENGAAATDVIGNYSWENGSTLTPEYNSDFYDKDNALGYSSPFGTVIDTINHRLFISDQCRILVYELSGGNLLTDKYPDNVLGQPGFSGMACGSGATGLNYAYGLAIDTTGQRLFVADGGNSRVLIFDIASITNGEAAVNVLGQPDFTTTSGGTTQAKLNAPQGLSYDSSTQRLFVPDQLNSRVMVFDVTSITNGENAINVLGQTDFTTSTVGNTQSKLKLPRGSGAVDEVGQRLFIEDTQNHRVMVFDIASITNGENAVNVLGQADFTSNAPATTSAGLSSPASSAYDVAGHRLFITDASNHRVLVYDVTSITNGEAAVNVLGQSNFTSGSSGLSQSALTFPYHLAFNTTTEDLYVVDATNYRVMVFNAASLTNGENAIDLLGQYDDADLDNLQPYYTKNGQYDTPNRRTFYFIQSLALDSVHHRMFVSDPNWHRVLVFNLNTDNTFPDKIADYVLGQSTFYTVDSPSTSASSISSPFGLAYDSTTDRLFVADRNNNRVLVFDTASITNGESALRVLGQSDFTSTGSVLSQSGLSSPWDISIDEDGQRLFVADNSNNRVVVFDVTSITNGENAVNVLGQADFTSATAETTQASLSGLEGLVYDSNHSNLFVNDYYNARVMVFDVASITDGENAVNVLGQPDFTTSSYRTQDSSFITLAQQMAFDTTTNLLYAPDTDYSRVMVFDIANLSNNMEASYVLGQPDFTSYNSCSTSPAEFCSPTAITIDSGNKVLYVGDRGSIRVFGVATDTPSFTKSVTTIAPAEGETTPPTFTVVLGAAPSTDVVINVSVDNTTSIGVSPSSLTFTSSNWDTPQTVTVTAVEDSNYDIDTGTITLSVDDALSDDSYDSLDDQTIAVTAYDNDRAVSSGGGGNGGSPAPITPSTPLQSPSTTPSTTDTTISKNPVDPEDQLEEQLETCKIPDYPTSYIKFGGKNDANEVMLLEQFLNLFFSTALTVNGIYEQTDKQAVIAFQEQYIQDILAPWKLQKGTGYVYIKTLAKIKQIVESRCR